VTRQGVIRCITPIRPPSWARFMLKKSADRGPGGARVLEPTASRNDWSTKDENASMVSPHLQEKMGRPGARQNNAMGLAGRVGFRQ
jgi:hypothetical protein